MGRSLADYGNAFGQVSDSVLSRPFNTKAEARHLVALANQAVRKARDVFTFEITQTWKDGFKALKAENDRLQKELKDWHELEEDQIQNYGREQIYTSTLRGAELIRLRETVRRDVAKMRDEHRRERFRRIADITKKWKDGFAALKVENDQMQKDLAKAYKDELQMIDERLGDMYEGLQA